MSSLELGMIVIEEQLALAPYPSELSSPISSPWGVCINIMSLVAIEM